MTNGFTNNHQFSPRSTQEDNQLDVIYQGDQDADLRDQFLDNYISDGSSKYSPEIQIRLNTVISVVRSCYKNRESFEGTKGDNIKKLLPCLKQATKEEALHVYEGLEVIVKSWLSNVKRELRGTYKCHSPTNDRNAAQHNDYLKCVFVYYGELEKIYHVTCTMVPSLENSFLKERGGNWLMMNRSLWHNEVHRKTLPNLNWQHQFIKTHKDRFDNLEREIRKAAFEFQLVESSIAKEKNAKFKFQLAPQFQSHGTKYPKFEDWQGNFEKSPEKNKSGDTETGSSKKSTEEQIRDLVKQMPQYKKTEADVYREITMPLVS